MRARVVLGWLAPAVCWSCGGAARRGEPLCLACRHRMRRPAAEPLVLFGIRVWAPVAYSGPARDLVRALKFRSALGVADMMAAQIVAGAPEGLLGGTIVPVPLHPKRLRSRGYNQAAVIAAAIARRTGLELTDCLVRTGPPTTQVGRARAERRAGPAGSVSLREGAAIAAGRVSLRERAALPPVRERSAGGRIVIVDDVVTTGATLAACAAALGARDVVGVAFARTIGR